MKRLVFHGDDLVAVDLPEHTRILKAPAALPGLADYEGEVRRVLSEPLGSEPLRKLVGPSSRVTIAFDDPCLPLPPMRTDVRGRAIGVILEELYAAGVPRNNVTLICAIGLHRKWTARELRSLLGRRLWAEMGAGRIRNHDAEDPLGMIDLGRTSGGHAVRVSRAVIDSDLLIYANVNWTSMNGGWKSILVGLGDYESIKAHHNVGVLAEGGSVMDHRAQFHDIMREMGNVVKDQVRIFTVETVLNSRIWSPPENRVFTLERSRQPLPFKLAEVMPQPVKTVFSSVLRSSYQPVAVHAGAIDEVHSRTLEVLLRQQNIRVEGQTDALFLALPNISPYAAFSRINPLLAMNAALGYIFNQHYGKPVVREGGVLILMQPFLPGFHLGHHPSYVEFYEKVLPETLEPYEMEAVYEADFAARPEYIDRYRFGNAFHGVHPFYVWYWAAIALKHLGRIIVVGAVDPAIPQRMGFETADSLERALGMAADSLGRGFSLTHLSVPPVFATETA